MPTLVLSPRHTANSQKLWRAAIAKGWEVIRLPSFRVPEEWAAHPPQDVVLYGEPLFNAVVAEALDLEIDIPPDDFLVQIGSRLSGRWVQLLTAREARRIDKPTFFKPPTHKSFKAGVYQTGQALPDSLEPNDPVLCQDVVKWLDEFRFFILNRRIVAESCYMSGGSFVGDTPGTCNKPFLYLARQMVEKTLESCSSILPDAVVIDAGVFFDRDEDHVAAGVIEANEASASGLYQCDPEAVLKVLQAAVQKRNVQPVGECLSDFDMRPEQQCRGKAVQSITNNIITFTDGTKIHWNRTGPMQVVWQYLTEPPEYQLPKM